MTDNVENKPQIRITFTTDAEQVMNLAEEGYCLHIMCHKGGSQFVYNDKPFHFGQATVSIISKHDAFTDFEVEEGTEIECLAAPLKFLYNQLPANHFGIGGCIDLWEDPVVPISGYYQEKLTKDFRRLCDRIGDTSHPFYEQMVGSLALTMVYDLFGAHSLRHKSEVASERHTDIVAELMAMLQSGMVKKQRDVAYYADQLHVSAKYLSNVVRKQTGRSVVYLIDQHTVPLLIEFLKNPKMSLTQIADEFNFSTTSYFSRYVTKHLGMSPSQYRLSKQPKKQK